MTSVTFNDQRLSPAVTLITSGRVKLASIDVFDTLLARRVPKPADVFLRLGRELQSRGSLGVGQSADSFAAIRYQTEYAARAAQQRQHGNREVTLEEIYSQVPREVSSLSAADLVAEEISVEHALCFINLDIVHLALLAKKHGLKISLISNSYYSEQALRGLLKAAAPDLPKPDAFFVSCEHRRGKRDGLMQMMLDHFKIEAGECLHIGDDPKSDRETARQLGIPTIYIGHSEEDFSKRLAEEQPIQWHERAAQFGGGNGDYGMTWLRRQAGFWPTPDLNEEHRNFYVYGARMLGPLLTGFAAWVQGRLQAEKAKTLYGLEREGGLLTELVTELGTKTNCKLLATSRLTAALASFSKDHPNHLEDFLTRRGHWTLGALMEQLGFDGDRAKKIGDPDTTLETLSPHALTEKLLASPLASELFERSAQRRQRLLAHLKRIGALGEPRLLLLDLGYAATIQRALQRIFTIEKIPVQTHGLYLISAHVSLATQAAGGIVEGFLAQNGNPNDFARAFCRSPEVVELSCMPSYGTVIDYTAEGVPLLAADETPPAQQHEIETVQRGIKDFAAKFRDLTAKPPQPSDFCGDGWRAQIRSVATRLVVYPSLQEAGLVGHWQADSDLGLTSPRPIISTGMHIARNGVRMATALAGLPRREVAWLYGTAATLSHSLARQVASLMLRKEEPAAFEPEASSFPFTQPAAAPESTERLHLQKLCDAILKGHSENGRFERAASIGLFLQPSLPARRFVYAYMAQRLEERGDKDLALGLRRKLWRIGGRDYGNFLALAAADLTGEPLRQSTFMNEACLAAMSAGEPSYATDVLDRSHLLAQRAYDARTARTPFQDSLSIAMLTRVFRTWQPPLRPMGRTANRPLRLCYVLAAEGGENYSPLTDITFALAEAHDSENAEAAIVSVHSEDQVLSSARLRAYVQNWRGKNKPIFFMPKAGENNAVDLRSLALQLASFNFDALIFTTLTHFRSILAALRPAHLMVGIGLGEIDFYTSPMLDFTAHMCDFPAMDGLCESPRLPHFTTNSRFHKPSAPITKAQLTIPDDGLLIMSSGRPVKFFSDTYWRVAISTLEQRPQVHLAVIGPTHESMRDWLKSRVPDRLLPRIHFLGWRNDHTEVLSAADIVLDTFPMGGGYNLIEAMQLGIPTLFCRNKTEDFFDLYKEQAWMPIGELYDTPELTFDWDNVAGIQQALLRLIDDPKLRKKQSAVVREAANQRRDIKPTIECLEDLIKKHIEALRDSGAAPGSI